MRKGLDCDYDHFWTSICSFSLLCLIRLRKCYQFSSTVRHQRFTFHLFSQSPSETWINAICTPYFGFLIIVTFQADMTLHLHICYRMTIIHKKMYIDNVKRGNMLKVDWICCIQYRHSVMNHCDRHITLFSDTDIHCISIYLLICLICLHILIWLLGDSK